MRMNAAKAFGLVCVLASLVLVNVRAQSYHGQELVKAQLIADTNAVAQGKSFTVGLFLRIAPGWHTYWKYSGDAGLPTEIK